METFEHENYYFDSDFEMVDDVDDDLEMVGDDKDLEMVKDKDL